MEEYNLSEYVKKLMYHFKNGNIGISVPSKNDLYYDEIKKIINVNDELFVKEAEVSSGAVYITTKEYELNIEYLYNFLVMCEALLTDEEPVINRFNKTKLRELKTKNIVDFVENKGEIEDIEVINIDLLKDEYFNMRYKVDSPISINVQNGITSNNFGNSNIQINCNITEKDINDFVQAILMLIATENDVPKYLKDDLANNRKDKYKLQDSLMIFSKWLIESGDTAQINASVPILTNIALQALSQLTIYDR